MYNVHHEMWCIEHGCMAWMSMPEGESLREGALVSLPGHRAIA